MQIIAIIATLASSLTGSTCAAIDNGPNVAAWSVPGTATVTTTYADMGERLQYADAPGRYDTAAWIALRDSERILQVGEAGRKVTVACTTWPV